MALPAATVVMLNGTLAFKTAAGAVKANDTLFVICPLKFVIVSCPFSLEKTGSSAL